MKLEHPVVVRGPSRYEPDAPVSIIELPDGTFRAFAANAKTVAIDGATPFALSGRSKVVLEPGPAGSPSECGRWLTSVLQGRGALYGLIHNEQHCDYRQGETYKSMAIARSEDFGVTWNVLGQIITADEGPASASKAARATAPRSMAMTGIGTPTVSACGTGRTPSRERRETIQRRENGASGAATDGTCRRWEGLRRR